MSTTDAVTFLLQFSSIGVFVVGVLYFITGTADSLSTRIPIGILAIVCALALLGLAEVIHILSDIRRAVEGDTASQAAPTRLRGRRARASMLPLEAVPEL